MEEDLAGSVEKHKLRKNKNAMKVEAGHLDEGATTTTVRPTSKYDYIKIKVWLGDHHEHYYILSRYLICRILTFIRVPQDKAIKIALDLKKWLVDNGNFEINQDELEHLLFKFLIDAGYGDAEINRFKMVSTFQQARRPLIILLFGVPCAAKTMVTQQLSYRLNLPHVLRTDALEEILKHHSEVHYEDPSEYLLSTDYAIGFFCKNCKTIRQALHGEFLKSVSDGKSIIIEGFHLDPALYIKEFNMQSAANDVKNMNASYSLLPDATMDDNREQRPPISNMDEKHDTNNSTNALVLGDHAVLFLASTEDRTKRPFAASNLSNNAAIFIPLILDIPEEQFETDAQPWLEEILHMAASSSDQFDTISSNKVIDRIYSIKRYIKESSLDGAVPCISLDTFNLDSSLDQIHEYIIACIELSLLDSN